jgi:type IV pilus assembly protein PilM
MLQVRERGDTIDVTAAARIDSPTPQIPHPAPESKPAAKAPAKARASDSQTMDFTVDPTLVEQIRASISAGRFSGRNCVVSLARHDVCVQSIRLPKMPDEELRQTAKWEASQRFGFDRAAMEVDFIRTGAALQGENREEVILIAAPHATIHARVEPLLSAGLRPIHVEPGFASLARAFSRQVRRESDRDQVRAVVEVGESGSTVMILRGDQIAFCKPFHICGRDFNKAVAEHLQLDEAAASELRAARIASSLHPQQSSEAVSDASTHRAVFEAVRPLFGELMKEVMLCLRYYGVTFRGHPPQRIILTGGAGQEPRLGEMMATACKTEVVCDAASPILGDLTHGIQRALNRTPGPGACWAVAAGAALRYQTRQRSRMDVPSRTLSKEAA